MKKVLTQNSFRNFSVFLTLIQFFFVICVKTEMWRWAIGCVWALKSALKTVLLSFLEGSSTELVMLTFFIGFILFEICRLSGEKFIQRLMLKNYLKNLYKFTVPIGRTMNHQQTAQATGDESTPNAVESDKAP